MKDGEYEEIEGVLKVLRENMAVARRLALEGHEIVASLRDEIGKAVVSRDDAFLKQPVQEL